MDIQREIKIDRWIGIQTKHDWLFRARNWAL